MPTRTFNPRKTTTTATGLMIEDLTPGWWEKQGGCHIEMRTRGGMEARALRENDQIPWFITGPHNHGKHVDGSTVWTKTDVIVHLADLIREALETDLALLTSLAQPEGKLAIRLDPHREEDIEDDRVLDLDELDHAEGQPN